MAFVAPLPLLGARADAAALSRCSVHTAVRLGCRRPRAVRRSFFGTCTLLRARTPASQRGSTVHAQRHVCASAAAVAPTPTFRELYPAYDARESGSSYAELLAFIRSKGQPERALGDAEALKHMVANLGRSGWFWMHLDLAYRASRAGVSMPDPWEAFRAAFGTGSSRNYNTLFAELVMLFKQDYENIKRGYYAMPYDLEPNPLRNPQLNPLHVATSVARFAREGANVLRRRQAKDFRDIWLDEAEFLPDYFKRNFHYQSDGYLSESSARDYDYLVEALFVGGADAMRRHCMVPLAEYLRGRDASQTKYLEVACGTGRSLTFVKQSYPELQITATDLSPFYLARARESLRGRPGAAVRFAQARAERLPFEDASFDVLNCIYLFHEIPEPIRERAAREFMRVLKPGGILVFMDSVQLGDREYLDPFLELFPQGYHEPFYLSYAKQDLTKLFVEEVGFEADATAIAFRSKLLSFRKPLSGESAAVPPAREAAAPSTPEPAAPRPEAGPAAGDFDGGGPAATP